MDIHSEVEQATLERFNRGQDRTVRDHGYGASMGALGVTKSSHEALSIMIKEHLKQVTEEAHNGFKPFAYVVHRLPPHVLAAATLAPLLHAVAVGDGLTATASAIGNAVQAECWAAGLLEHDTRLHARIERAARTKHANAKYRRQAARSIAKRAGYMSKSWSRVLRVRGGIFLLNSVLKALPDIFTIEEMDGQKFMQITKHGLALAEAAVDEAIDRSPVFLPSPEPLAPWSGFRSGGYWDERARFNAPIVRAYHKATVAEIKGAMKDGTMEPHIRALNALQAVPFKINTRILDVVKWAYENDVPVKGIPSRKDGDDLARLSDEDWADESKRRLHRHRLGLKKEHDLGLRSNRVLFHQDITTAEKLALEQQFYTPLNCDWRGRVYSVPHFAFARDDRVRALFLFGQGMPIGEEGLKWLKVHVANCGDFDKISKRPFEEREQWTNENLKQLCDAALEPKEWRWWTKADKPFLFLAACMELSSAVGTSSSFMTCLPIAFDGSCSGLQHLCAMTRAEEGALVNLTDQELPQDVYQRVASLVEARLRGEVISAGAPGAAGHANQALAYGITRKLVKRNVMTYSYSSKRVGMAQQQLDDLMKPLEIDVLAGKLEEHPFASPDDTFVAKSGKNITIVGRAAAKYLASHIYAAIEEVVQKPAQAMAFLQSCARVMAQEGKPVSWVTPTGLPWANRYHEPRVSEVKLWLSDKPIWLSVADGVEKEIAKDKVASGIAPNFVHALDAAHLLLTVNACVAEGITNIATVHDSFGCLAPQAVRFNQIIREQFVQMYEEHDVLQEVLDACKRDLNDHNARRLPDVPIRGELNIREVLNAKYCFA